VLAPRFSRRQPTSLRNLTRIAWQLAPHGANTLPIRPFLPPTDQIPSSDLMSSLTRDVIRRDRARDELFAIIGKMPLKSLLGFSRSRNFPIP